LENFRSDLLKASNSFSSFSSLFGMASEEEGGEEATSGNMTNQNNKKKEYTRLFPNIDISKINLSQYTTTTSGDGGGRGGGFMNGVARGNGDVNNDAEDEARSEVLQAKEWAEDMTR
jgi:hypothetical protein